MRMCRTRVKTQQGIVANEYSQETETVAVEDYLAGELISPIKHEYLGLLYAMAVRGSCTIASQLT